MNGLNQLTFTLKQHTPIIHFQHFQHGATLRATEVKPKLDRYIIESLTGVVGKAAFDTFVGNPSWKKLLTGIGEHPTLDYKIKFKPLSATTATKIPYSETKDGKFRPEFPGIFGNVNLESEKKVFVFCDVQEICIHTYSSELKGIISKMIAQFFQITNFGFRQSKGFGSYSIDDFAPHNACGSIYFNLKHKADSYKAVFTDIDLFYRCLKSGLNIKTRDRERNAMIDVLYFKSLMFKYAKKLPNPQQWDKRTLRHALFIDNKDYKDDYNETGVFYRRTNSDSTVRYSTPKPANSNYFDFRDLLGLSTEQDWIYYRSKVIKKVYEMNRKHESKYGDEIQRSQSPLTIKPYYNKIDSQWYVYITSRELEPNYLSATVVAEAKHKSTELTIFPDFNVEDYLHFAIREFDKNDIEYGKGYNERNTKEAAVIIDIFSDLRKNQNTTTNGK